MKGNCEESEQHQNQLDDCNETWGCPLLLPVPTWCLFPIFLSSVSIRSGQGKILERSVIKDAWKVA